MVVADIRNIKSSVRDLRKFGLTVGIAAGLFGLLFLWRDKGFYVYFLYASGVLLVAGAVAPIALWPLHKLWMTLAILLGWVMTRLLLGLLFFAVITPIGLALRIAGKDYLSLKHRRHTATYWVPKERGDPDKSRYERQF